MSEHCLDRQAIVVLGGGLKTGLEALQSVQFVAVRGERLAVISLGEWEAMVEWLEAVEDTEVARQAYDEPEASGGDRERAGWFRWDQIRDDLGLN
jgi:hypothetical protein